MQQSGHSRNGDNPIDDISFQNGRNSADDISFQNGHNSDPLQLDDDDIGSVDLIRNISFKRLGLTTANTSTSTRLNNNNNGRSNSASPLNLSVDADDSQPDSSIGTFDSKVKNKTKHFWIATLLILRSTICQCLTWLKKWSHNYLFKILTHLSKSCLVWIISIFEELHSTYNYVNGTWNEFTLNWFFCSCYNYFLWSVFESQKNKSCPI